MSDARGREPNGPDADAWAEACAEDLAAERARRRARGGPEPAGAAEELRRLAETVADRLAGLAGSVGGAAGPGQDWARQLADGARAAVEPVVQRNPEVFEHLSAAGSELLAAYRSAVAGQERRWTRDARDTGRAAGPGPSSGGAEPSGAGPSSSPEASGAGPSASGAGERAPGADRPSGRGEGRDEPPGAERIELD
ncbi:MULTISPECIES: DUF5304 family protein [Streptomyces]|uniref:DUF5304 family protein n=1 Tax=Streptomyces TaxID=1883 RepID=UPI002249321B|nr:DUF5304 family protein [Streptomyces sp. JHD 1]MCX2967658.1 DUF5304 family protein [Streptomyces sp. JHD 1]